jgi:N4-(beta-N-acetylglucosaminyl)-L-asparaginase
MKGNRRNFIFKFGLATMGVVFGKKSIVAKSGVSKKINQGPIFISTWKHGLEANTEALKVIKEGGSGLDAVEQGVMVVEADPDNSSVGIGGMPDRTGKIALDACIMSSDGSCGAVCMLENIVHPISVARKVMEDTPHVLLAAEGAYDFALSKGFKRTNLNTGNSKKAYKEWKKNARYKPVINVENHDTIGMLCMDKNGDIFGSCTTSGLAFKMRGRIGDSPIIGAGLFIDNEVGGAVATGLGESVIKVAGSAIIVELMRHGYSPEDACKEVVMRIVKNENTSDIQVGFIAINKAGEVGSYSIHPGFNYALTDAGQTKLVDSDFIRN